MLCSGFSGRFYFWDPGVRRVTDGSIEDEIQQESMKIKRSWNIDEHQRKSGSSQGLKPILGFSGAEPLGLMGGAEPE